MSRRLRGLSSPRSGQLVSGPAVPGYVGNPADFTLAFSDTFNARVGLGSDGPPDPAKWENGYFNGANAAFTTPVNTLEDCCYATANARVETAGHLRLSVTANSNPACLARDSAVAAPWAGACLTTIPTFSAAQMVLVVRAALPRDGTGDHLNWPAAWTAAFDDNWPASGEFDLLESLSGSPKGLSAHYHYSGGAPGWSQPSPSSMPTWTEYVMHREGSRCRFWYDGLLLGTQTTGIVTEAHKIVILHGVNTEWTPIGASDMLVDFVHVFTPV